MTSNVLRTPKWRSGPGLSSDWMSLDRLARIASRLLLVAAFFLAAAIGGFWLYSVSHVGHVYEGVSVGGVDLGGMTASEAKTALSAEYGTFLAQPIPLTFNGQSFAFMPIQSGISLDVDRTTQAAMSFGRSGSLWDRSRDWARAILRGETVPVQLEIDQTELWGTLTLYTDAVAQAPQNAYVQMDAAGAPQIVAERSGVAYDVGSTQAEIIQHISAHRTGAIQLVSSTITPTTTGATLAASLEPARSAVAADLVLTGMDRFWAIPADDLKHIVAVSSPGTRFKSIAPRSARWSLESRAR